MWCTDNGKSSESVGLFELFGSAHVYEPQITVRLDHDVLWLQISIDDTSDMQVFDA